MKTKLVIVLILFLVVYGYATTGQKKCPVCNEVFKTGDYTVQHWTKYGPVEVHFKHAFNKALTEYAKVR